MHAMNEIPEHVDLGCAREDLGTHSNRKFAESYAVSKVDGPSHTQVCLRANQSVGRSQDCYMFPEEDGDSLTGRALSMLKFDADQFDVLPCHFGTVALQELHEYGWNRILEGYDHYPASYKRCIPKFLASLVYHYFKGDLERLYPVGHPIYMQLIFTDRTLINSLKDKVIVCYSYCSDTHMSAQGVPGFIVISREIRVFREHFDTKLRQRDEQDANITSELKQMLDHLPLQIVSLILEKVQVEGAKQISLEDIRQLITEIVNSPSGPLGSMCDSLKTLGDQQLRIANRIESMGSTSFHPHEQPAVASNMTGFIHYWTGIDDKLHMVPSGFVWPSFVTSVMWNLWFFGDSNRRICAFKSISVANDLITKQCKVNASRTKKVISKMVELAVDGEKITRSRDITLSNSQAVYDFSFAELLKLLYNQHHVPERPGDINILTLANRMQKRDKN